MSERHPHTSRASQRPERRPTPRGRHSATTPQRQFSRQRQPFTRQHLVQQQPETAQAAEPSHKADRTQPQARPHPRARQHTANGARPAPIRSAPTRSAAAHTRGAHSTTTPRPSRSYRTPPRRARHSFRPIPILLALLAALILLVTLIAHACSSGNTNGDDPNEAQLAAGTFENDGSLVLTLLGDEDTIVLAGEGYVEGGCQAFDKKSGPLTSRVQTEGSVDTTQPGDYQITYRVTRDDGMTATRVRNVHVVDSMDADTDGIPVMMYHHIYTDDDPPDTDDTNYLHADKLKAQLKWLQKNDYYFPSFAELRAYVDGTHSLPAKSVVLTFDDGQMGFFKHGVPLLNKYKVPATSFVIGDRSRTPKVVKKYPSEYVSFQSHSYGLHNDGSDASIGRGGIIYDYDYNGLVDDAVKMGELIGPYDAMAYPYGDVSDAAPAALQAAGVKCAFTIVYGNVHPGDDPMRLNRVRVFGESSLESWIYQVQTGE